MLHHFNGRTHAVVIRSRRGEKERMIPLTGGVWLGKRLSSINVRREDVKRALSRFRSSERRFKD
jgi:hypothetical protein